MKQMLLLFLIFFSCHSITNAQKATIVILHYHPSDFFKDSFLLEISQPVHKESYSEFYYPNKLISFIKQGNNFTTTTEYDITDTACAIFSLGYGHEIVVIPGDTVEITIASKISDKINGIYPSPWMNEFTYSGKNKFIYSLFDSLAYIAGDLRWPDISIGFSEAGNNPDSFFHLVTRVYDKRINFLKNYSEKHFIPLNIFELVKAEITAAYFNNLVSPVGVGKFKKSFFPSSYKSELEQVSFIDPEKFFSTSLYSTAAYNSALYITLNEILDSLFTDRGIIDVYNYIKKNYFGDMRNYLITDHLSKFINAPGVFLSLDSLLNDFKNLKNNEIYISYLAKEVEKKEKEVKKNLSLEESLLSYINDTTGKKMVLKKIFKKRPLIIDCWATWCVPCLRQIPFSRKLEKKYRSKIDFVYLSFDKNRLKWKSKISDVGIKRNSFLLQNNFTSDFAKYFKIFSIPRYIIFDKKGNLVTDDAPRPNDKKFSDLIKNLLQN